jgi:hypothetical protein
MTATTRRAALGTALAAIAAPALGQGFPERPIRWLVGYPAGGGTDVLARLLAAGCHAARRADRGGEPPGAATNLAAEAAANAAPDGTTVFTAATRRRSSTPPSTAACPSIRTTACARSASWRASTWCSARSRAGRRRRRPSWGRAGRAGRMDYGSPGIGSPHHLATERWRGRSASRSTTCPIAAWRR